MDWNGFRVLLAVVEHGTFSKAARQLGLSQPTVGRHIAALESALGARLVVRQKRGITLTHAGESILADVQRMASAASDAARRGASDAVEVDGVVRVTCSEGLGTLWLSHRLAPLRERHPRLRLELVLDNASIDLARREADVAVRLVRPRQPGLVARRHGSLGFGMFASPGYLAARGTPRTLKDLSRHDLIGFAAGAPTPRYMRSFVALAPPARFVLRTNHLLAQHEAARAGFGVVLAPSALLEGDVSLVRVLPRITLASLELWLVIHEDLKRSARVQVVYRALSAALLRERDRLAG